MVGRVARLEQYLDEETDVHTEKKLYAVLLIYTKFAGEAQKVVEGPLKDMAVRWRLAEIIPGSDGASVLQYLVRLKPGVQPGLMLDTIRKEGGDHVQAPSYGHSGVEPRGGNRHEIAYPVLLCCVAALVSIAPVGAAGQAPAFDEPQVPALFSSHELIEFTIETDYGALRGDRTQDSEYRPAILRMTDDEGAARTIDIRVRTRGLYRLENCRCPPLRVNLPRNSMGGTVFDGQNGIRLVSHCRDRDDDEQHVLEEYLVYRTFNLLTDESFRVRLARVTYTDGEDDDDPVVRYAFFREESEAMAERVGGAVLGDPTG